MIVPGNSTYVHEPKETDEHRGSLLFESKSGKNCGSTV